MRRINRVHLIGIGGSGMGGIAEVLHNCGYKVSGSDLHKSAMTEHLAKLGIPIAYSHIVDNVASCDVVVYSSAIQKDNIELVAARNMRIPVVPRAEMLAELMRFKQGIAIAGTHGKTTTTSLIASLLAKANLDPTFVIGGQLNSLCSNARLGMGDYFVAEADESDVSFLHLSPTMVIITNIDQDHLSSYENDFEKLKEAFVEFVHRMPFYGLAVVCIDDPVIREILPKIMRPVLTYGFSDDADIQAIDFTQQENISKFAVKFPWEKEKIELSLNLPGKHNVLNALAAMAVSSEVGVDFSTICASLREFQGIKRRFQVIGNYSLAQREITLVDDYGHHPQEVKMVINAVRDGWSKKRLVMVFQPHRYSRLQSLFEDFSAVLSEVDKLYVLDVYSAGEEPTPGINSKTLCGNIRSRGKIEPVFVENVEDLLKSLNSTLQDNDILLMQGAGDISKIAHHVAEEFSSL